MSETLMKLVVDVKTGAQEYIELTEEELAQRELDSIAAEAAEAERLALETAKAEAKAAAESKLEALGLTPEEIAAITGS